MTHDFAALPPGPYDLEWAERLTETMELNHHRARCGRNIRTAVLFAVLALLVAAVDAGMWGALIAIALAAFYTRLAVRDQRRADAVFARGVAAALLDGVPLAELSEAA